MQSITTGIDRLLRILKEKKKIQLEDLAKELDLDVEVVEDWVDLMEKEDLITTKTKLSKTWVEIKNIDDKKVVKTGNEIISQKQAFSRKIQVAIKALEKDTSGFEDLKNKFNELQGHIKSEIDTVREEMKELESYDKLKKNINKDIEVQKKQYEQFVKAYEDQISDFQKKEEVLLKNLEKEQKHAEELTNKVKDQHDLKKKIENKINDSLVEMSDISKEMNKYMSEISGTEKRIEGLKKDITKFKVVVEKNKEDKIKQLAKKLGVDKEKIERQQDELIKKSKLTIDEMRTYSETQKILYLNMDSMFGKKIKITEMIEDIEKEKEKLKTELQELNKRVGLFNALKKDDEIKSQMANIEKTMKSYESRKNSLVNKIYDLTKLIGQ